jgi:hypothetical protein
MKKYLVWLSLYLLFASACTMGARPVDWEDFDPIHIDNNLSEKGLLNGYRVIFWQNVKGSYSEGEIVNYAAGKGWTLEGTEKRDSTDLACYQDTYRVIVDTVFKSHKKRESPQWFKGGGIWYKFKFVQRASKKYPPKAYRSDVFVSADQSEMCVYPLLDDS